MRTECGCAGRLRCILSECRPLFPGEGYRALLHSIFAVRMLVFRVDDILDSTIDIVQDLLTLLVCLVQCGAFVLLVFLGAPCRFREIVQHSHLFGTLFQRSFQQLPGCIAARTIRREWPRRALVTSCHIRFDSLCAQMVRKRLPVVVAGVACIALAISRRMIIVALIAKFALTFEVEFADWSIARSAADCIAASVTDTTEQTHDLSSL